MLAKIDKSAVLAQTDGDESKRPSGVMVDADGDFVVAKTDKATWEKFQAKANTTSAKAKTAEDKQIEERGLACSLDKKMFVDPMKTPCCRKTFCNDCITNALIESDFVCPACQTEGVLLDDLQPDEEMSEKVQEYLKEQKTAKSPEPASPTRKAEDAKIVETAKTEGESKEEPEKTEEAKNDKEQEENSEEKSQASGAKDKTKSPTPQPAKTNSPPTGPKSMAPQDSDGTKTEGAKPDESNPKKRQADDFLENPRIPKGPRAMQNQQQNQMPSMGMNGMPPNMGGMNGMMGMPPNMNMGMPNMMGMPGMNMGMPPPMMGMPMMGIPGFNGNFGMNSGGGGWDMGNMGNMGNMGMNGFGGGMMNGFQNGMNFGPQNGGGAEEDAYFRKPVNPHRHQNKQRRTRPSDYREL
jgi:protein MPE1